MQSMLQFLGITRCGCDGETRLLSKISIATVDERNPAFFLDIVGMIEFPIHAGIHGYTDLAPTLRMLPPFQ